jgi:exodeoxyribonuclease VII large subunit
MIDINNTEKNKGPYTVTEYIKVLNQTINKIYGEVVGEVSEVNISAKGHVYFSIQDKDTKYVLPCVIWGPDYVLSGVKLNVGMEILIKGNPNVYGPWGKLSFHTKTLELIGEGALKKAYDILKKTLTEEGLLNIERKRLIPRFPKRIGVITSIKGDVIHDFRNNLSKHGFKIKLIHTMVEGQESGKDLILSVRAFKKENIDVLVLIRGGGSIQSLAGFDNEILVREIANFPAPVITGIGHHKDVPLVALVADKAESTPSIVATFLNSSWQEANKSIVVSQRTIFDIFNNSLQYIDERVITFRQDIFEVFERLIENKKQHLAEVFDGVKSIFGNILNRYDNAKNIIKQNWVQVKYSISSSKREIYTQTEKILNEYQSNIENLRIDKISEPRRKIINKFKLILTSLLQRFINLNRIIDTNNPERQLKLGYSLVRSSGKLIKSIQDLRVGDEIETQFSNGYVQSKIKSIK